MAAFQVNQFLTPQDVSVLKTDMDGKLNTVIGNGKTIGLNLQESNFQAIADYYNENENPQIDLWRPDINPRASGWARFNWMPGFGFMNDWLLYIYSNSL